MSPIRLGDDLLHRRAAAAAHVAEQTRRHLQAEYNDDVDEILSTLAEEGPYAYTHPPQIDADGKINQKVETTFDGIRNVYHALHDGATVLPIESLIEIRGEWYTFHAGIGNGELKTGKRTESDTLVIFPIGSSEGITGELFWWRPLPINEDAPPAQGAPVTLSRRELLVEHNRLLDAFRTGDIEAIDASTDDNAKYSIRDYVDDTGTLIEIHNRDESRAYYERFYEKFDVLSVDIIYRIVEDWFLFTELRYTARLKTGPDAGSEVAFNTAEFTAFAPDGRGLVRTGHGTDLEPHLP
ncbi:MAG: nuclear transport factor 2 family protein [Microbacterium sp.]